MTAKLDEFIKNIVKYDTVDDIIKQYDEQTMKGFVFERLWDLMIKFGFCDEFPGTKYIHMIGNVNNGNVKRMKSIKKYIKKNTVCSGNSGGCSDITLFDKRENKYIFISCKFPSSDEGKDVTYYDVQNIIAMCDNNRDTYEKYKIYILVPNKQKVFRKIHNASETSSYITKHMNNILDLTDLNNAFEKFKKDIVKHTIDEYDDVYCCKKEKLKMRFHQELIVTKTSKLIKEGNKQILWGCKCRSGKTYMVGGLISLEKDKHNTFNVMIVTPAPSETIPQFTDGLFNAFSDFEHCEIHEITNGKALRHIKVGDNNIIIVSKQLMQNYIGKTRVDTIVGLNLDLIVFDENHFTGTTELSKQIIGTYACDKTVKLYLTATYNKPLHEWNIHPECQLYWDIEDEKLCKQHNVDKLVERHGDYVNRLITKFSATHDKLFEPYNNYPELHLITNMWDNRRYEKIKEKIMDSKYGFSFDVLFSIGKNNGFEHPVEVRKVLRYISGSEKERDYKDGDKSILNRISRICDESGSRMPFTQLWFLPIVNINKISMELKKLMEEDDVLKDYDVLIVNSKNDELQRDIKMEIEKRERIAKKHCKNGLIILVGNMLSLGITLEKCDVVFLMNNTLSSDKVMQQMYRCMTETSDGSKKYGYVVDLNISRVLNTCITYNIRDANMTVDEKIKYVATNIINFDGDYFINKEVDVQKIVDKLVTIWKDDPLNHYMVLLKNLDDSYAIFDNATQKLINQKFISAAGDRKHLNAKILIGDENDEVQSLPSGKEVTTKEDKKEETKKLQEFIISFPKDVLHYVVPLVCILTMDNDKKNFMEMMNMIRENGELTEIFDDQSQIWWNQCGLMDVIREIVDKYYDENSVVYNISVQFKMQIKSLIDEPKKLLELIDACLKPKESDKKKFGEVFTPMKLVNEMLDKLPKEVWTNEKFKWFDPAAGMGNFPIAVYMRLMESLKEKIPNESKRKRHILENMIYMSELNKKNCYVVQQIFNMNKKYKLNLHCGDTLKMNAKKAFGVDKFDVVIGNPPYNAFGTKASGNTVWQQFVTAGIEMLHNNGYIVFIHPNGWRKPNTDRGKFYGLFETMSKDNTMIYLEIHNTKDGMSTFHCGTRYDWYVIQKKQNDNYMTIIIDENGAKIELDLSEWKWLPNCEFQLIRKLIGGKEKCRILQSMSAYEPRKKWISKTKTTKFKYPIVHSTPRSGVRYVWSSRNDNGFFGIKKVIFGDSGICCPIIDIDGKYGMTQHAMGIVVGDKSEGNEIIKAITSNKFEKVLDACLWSSYAIEWNIFTDFRRDFYKYIIE